jgi:hypothetical protein
LQVDGFSIAGKLDSRGHCLHSSVEFQSIMAAALLALTVVLCGMSSL